MALRGNPLVRPTISAANQCVVRSEDVIEFSEQLAKETVPVLAFLHHRSSQEEWSRREGPDQFSSRVTATLKITIDAAGYVDVVLPANMSVD
jgi:hypothetical protein